MIQTLTVENKAIQWVNICSLEDILPNTGVCALVNGEQVAIFRVGTENEIYAISNYDPFSKAYVLSRGLIGDKKGILNVASPIYKQNFSLTTGECLDDSSVKIPIYPVQIVEGTIQVGYQLT